MAPADKGTGKKQDIKITGASTLGSDEVDRMVKDAEQYADEDKKQREAVDVKNQARFSLSVVGHALMRKVVSLLSVCGADWLTHVLLLFLLSIPWPTHRCLRLPVLPCFISSIFLHSLHLPLKIVHPCLRHRLHNSLPSTTSLLSVYPDFDSMRAGGQPGVPDGEAAEGAGRQGAC